MDVALIVPGPKKPRNLDIYIEPLLDDLVAYGPAGLSKLASRLDWRMALHPV